MRLKLCEWCSNPITGHRSHKRYCSDKCRGAAWAARDDRSNAPACYYCGAPANGIDHIPPRMIRAWLVGNNKESMYEFIEVPCCLECNSLLGHNLPWTAAERKQKIKKMLAHRYRKILVMKDFTEQELQEMGYNLQTSTRAKLIWKDITRKRLAW